MPNTELTAAKPAQAKRAAAASKRARSTLSSASAPIQGGLFDDLDRASLRPTAQPDHLAEPVEVSVADLPPVQQPTQISRGSTGLTVAAFAAIAVVAGGLGFVTSSEPELITGSITLVDQAAQTPVVEQAAFILPQADKVSLPVSAALGVGESFLIKVLLVCLALATAIGAGCWGLRRLLSPKASRLQFDGRDQRIDASLVPPTISAR